jgi:hypothetical protein
MKGANAVCQPYPKDGTAPAYVGEEPARMPQRIANGIQAHRWSR